MFIDEPDFHPFHGVAVMLAGVFPDHQGFVLDVAVSQVALSESVVFGFGGSLLFEAFFFVFEFLFLWNFGFELGTRCFKLVLSVEEFNCIKASFSVQRKYHH